MKHVFVVLILLCVGNAMPCMGKCETCNHKPNKANLIYDYPFVISKSGRYKFDSNLVLSQNDINDAAIIIKADNVMIDMAGYTLDMKYSGMTGIVIGGVKNIRIYNGRILHTGQPGKIHQVESPFANNPLRGIGLAIKEGSEKIYIENMTFEENFIGIGCLDNGKHISILNCQGIACGLKRGGSHLGGFIVIAPTEAHSDQVFENIKISECNARSKFAQYGIAVFNAKNLWVDLCTIHHPINSGAIYASECHHVNFEYLTADGGGISTENCTDANIFDCYCFE